MARSPEVTRDGDEAPRMAAVLLSARGALRWLDPGLAALLKLAGADPVALLRELREQLSTSLGVGQEGALVAGGKVHMHARPLEVRSERYVLCLVSIADNRRAFPPLVNRAGLTPREREVCERVVRGLSNSEIAQDLGCATSTVRVHLIHVFEKVRVRSRVELTTWLLSGGSQARLLKDS